MNKWSSEWFFRQIVHYPRVIIILSISMIFLMGSFVFSIQKDTRADAFLSDENPALIYRDKVKQLFGLSDPMVVALFSDETIFTVEALNTVIDITEIVRNTVNVDPTGMTSLATENNIVGNEEGLIVDPFLESPINTSEAALSLQTAIRDFPLYQGSLVSNDEKGTLIIAELMDEKLATDTYNTLLKTLSEYPLPEGLTVHIAGEGAISGYLGSYIDADAQRLNPLAAIVISTIIMLAFWRWAAMMMSSVIILASVGITLGAMAASGVPFYVITNALPVILIGIAVADSIHIYHEYFARRIEYPQESFQDSVVETMKEMWRPITLTTLTTVSGFLGLALAAYMPPFKMFGFFTALGVTAAWLYSLIFLPAVMSLLKTEVHARFIETSKNHSMDLFSRVMQFLGKLTQTYPKSIVVIATLILGVGSYAASQLQVNEIRINTFHPSEPLYQADKAINQAFDGTYYLDIVIETPETEGIFEPEVLKAIDNLQRYAETLPTVQGSISIVDYLKQMNRALNGGDVSQYTVPLNSALVAQYMLLYSASSAPTDFEEEVDYDYRLANVRVQLNSGGFQKNKIVVEALEHYLTETFNQPGMIGNLSGRVNINYHWIKDLGSSHFMGMMIALGLVWAVASLLFRSLVAGFLSLLPVGASILLVYAAMVAFNIPLGIGTSMFAAVAIGLGVDFAIHTIDRIKSLNLKNQNIAQTLEQFYPTTGRALLFNLLAIGLGFGVLVSSQVVPLKNFGMIVSLSVTVSFFMSMTLIPALMALFKPHFLFEQTRRSSKTVNVMSVLVFGVIVSSSFIAHRTEADEMPNGLTIMEKVKAVDEGNSTSRRISMTMIDRNKKKRQRETISYRQYFGTEKRTVLYYLTPKNVKNTAFLTHDFYEADKEDNQWLYLPALRKTRRISASDRGDYFLGTDFTYEDIKNEGKPELSDYHYKTLGQEEINGVKVWRVEGLPVSSDIARELGYGKIHSWVDASNWMVVKSQYWDEKLNPLKTLEITDIRLTEGIWTRYRIFIDNHKTQHTTEFIFSDVKYNRPLKSSLFTRQSLLRGAPR